tara:strand:+ start:707 stop:1378 length:672 start_codon:yes stop_codon:yes gene_type:complete
MSILTPFQEVMLKIFSLTVLSFVPAWFIRNKIIGDEIEENENEPLTAKIARNLLHVLTFAELARGTLHFFFPIKSHTHVSGMLKWFDLEASQLQAAFVFMNTYQMGVVNLLLGFMYQIPYIFGDAKLVQTCYMFVVTTIIRVLQQVNATYSIWTDIFERMPSVIRSTNTYSSESLKTAPPAKLVQNLSIFIVIIGLVCSFDGYFKLKHDRDEKREKKKERLIL